MATRPKILIVDDEEEARSVLLKHFSKKIDAQLLEAGDGREAINLLNKEKFDLILLDIAMPGISGMDVIKEATRLDPNAYIIVTTGWDSARIAEEVIRKGAIDYIPKPFSVEVLEEKVKSILIKKDKFIPKN